MDDYLYTLALTARLKEVFYIANKMGIEDKKEAIKFLRKHILIKGSK